jgi:hypothetical protein
MFDLLLTLTPFQLTAVTMAALGITYKLGVLNIYFKAFKGAGGFLLSTVVAMCSDK